MAPVPKNSSCVGSKQRRQMGAGDKMITVLTSDPEGPFISHRLPVPDEATRNSNRLHSGKMNAAGRGEALRRMSACLPPNLNPDTSYRPVGISNGGRNVPLAIPGESTIAQSWKTLSNAPVAFQVQKMHEGYFGETSLESCSNNEDGRQELGGKAGETNTGTVLFLNTLALEKDNFEANNSLKVSHGKKLFREQRNNSLDKENLQRKQFPIMESRLALMTNVCAPYIEKPLGIHCARDANPGSEWEPLDLSNKYQYNLMSDAEFPAL